ncbi:hypothetical protein FA10DRAFT_231068 [Acaromyces ingoldii]|uniref:20S-pre-rRNA D-site endonuclease NOB1 n=1 Tax=Acaromyces ingoldii TaxID=215250 RepID=A0A316YLK8_9BASI|nr:hypothetical protein FA10DRAFT_231068 [Acaromyces ingoldii]PWN90129.1 hypothetical protein FA10DRAFT_231068 [Acaromyces ingoldii]
MASTSTPTGASEAPIDALVLDAGPLVTRTSLGGLAKKFYVPASVVAELRDVRAREHFEWLQRTLDVEVRDAGPEALLGVVKFAKKTGDYAVLSRPDMSVLALTYALELERHGTWRVREDVGGKTGQQKAEEEKLRKKKEEAEQAKDQVEDGGNGGAHETSRAEQDESGAADAADAGAAPVEQSDEQAVVAATPDAEREDDEDDEEEGGEWITPDNVVKHKNRSLGLQQQQQQAGKKKGKKGSGRLTVACMTGDYAVQNVLLQMGLSLVGIEGQRIKQVKSWVLRCHACAKICKDSERKFCPHCGNPTLLRTSVTSTSPDATGKAGTGQSHGGLQVHLKKNFQYRNRGTIYSLPLPKPGKAGGKPASVPVLREDQAEWQRAVQKDKVQRQKEEKRLNRALEKGKDSLTARYEDADELTMLLAGGTGKNRGKGGPVEMPEIGVGRKNPNERRRRKV